MARCAGCSSNECNCFLEVDTDTMTKVGSGTSGDPWILSANISGGPTGPTGPTGATGPVGSTGPTGATGPAGAGLAWTQNINESGSSFANWTSGGGTWSSDGTLINQTDTAGSVRNAAFNTRFPFAISELTADIRINSGSGADWRAGIYIGNALLYIKTTNSGTSYTIVAENRGTSVATTTSIAGTGVVFFTVKALVVIGQGASFWVNGTFIGSAEMGNTGDASQLNLYTFAANASFRNIAVYNPNLPI